MNGRHPYDDVNDTFDSISNNVVENDPNNNAPPNLNMIQTSLMRIEHLIRWLSDVTEIYLNINN